MLIGFSSEWESRLQALSCAISTTANNIQPFSECASRNAMTPTARARDRIPAFRALQGDAQTRIRPKPAVGRLDREQSRIAPHRKRVLWAVDDSSRRNLDCRRHALPEGLAWYLRGRVRSTGRSIPRPEATATDAAIRRPPMCWSA